MRAIAALVFLGALIVGIVIFVRDVIFLTTTEIAITNRRIIRKIGLFDRHTSEMELSCVAAVNLDQDFWGKALAFGRLKIHGTGDDDWASPLLANPVAFRRELEAAAGRLRRPTRTRRQGWAPPLRRNDKAACAAVGGKRRRIDARRSILAMSYSSRRAAD